MKKAIKTMMKTKIMKNFSENGEMRRKDNLTSKDMITENGLERLSLKK